MSGRLTGFLSRPRGFAVIFAAFIFFVVGVIYGLEQLYIMFAAIVSLPAASYVMGWLALRGLQVRRRLPRQGAEGDTIRVELLLTNSGRYGKLLFRVDDQLPPWLESDDPGGNVPRLAARETKSVCYEARALKRGVYAVGPARLSASDPVALFDFHTEGAPASEVVVHPRPVVLADLPLGGEPLFHGRHASRQRAEDGIDFHSTREYQPGDDLRRIHWKSTARRNTFTVLEFERSHSGGVTVVLDLAPEAEVGVGRHTTLEYAVKAAAGIAKQVLSRGAAFRLVARGAEDHSLRVAGGTSRLGHVLEALARVAADGTQTVAGILRELAGRLGPGRCVVVVSAGVQRETASALAGLARLGAAPVVILLRADTFALAAAARSGVAEQARGAAPAPEAYRAYADALRRAGVAVREVRCFDPGFNTPAAGDGGLGMPARRAEEEAAGERASAA